MADQIIQQLKKILGSDAVVCDDDELLVYECDGLPQHKLLPRAVVFPNSTEEVSEIVRILSAAKIPFTARGAGTGVSGGALAKDRGVIIELARMRRLLRIDTENRIAVVQTGLINSHLSKAAAPFNLYYAPDPSSQTACTIGGNIAENAGGSHCLKYGVTVDHVIAARVVLSDGRIVDLDAGTLTPGYDLVGVFVGSEGTFGIATEATLRLLPTPPAVRTILAEFPDVNNASRAVSAIIAAGLVPAALEMIDAATIRAVEASVFAAGLPADAEAALIIELDGLEAGLDSEATHAETICREHGAREVRRAVDEKEREKIWKARKGAFGAMGRISPDVMIQDAVVPRSKLPKALAAIYQIADKYNLEVANVFHAGDGNLHPLLCYDSRDEYQLAHIKDAGREIMETCVEAGGSITGEHGVGLDKIEYLPLIFSDDDMETMLRVRAAFDPIGLCNPGKIIPLRRGCGEKRVIATKESGLSEKAIADEKADAAKSYAVMTPPDKKSSSGIPVFDSEKARASVAKIIGEENVRANALGCPLAAFPTSVEEISELLRLAERENWAVIPAGSGTWLDAGNPVGNAVLSISTSRHKNLIEYEPADLVVTAEAGMKLSELNANLDSQWLPIDPPDDGRATLGGVAATGMPGAQAFGYGAPRHHVIGMRVALADGRIVKAGGRVVKNVAGYDLCKLFTGSYGTLGMIVELTFKLRPRPLAEITIAAQSSDYISLIQAARMILSSELLPVAVELLSPGNSVKSDLITSNERHTLLIRFAGADETVSYQVKRAVALIENFRQIAAATISDDAGLWSELATIPVQNSNKLIWRSVVPRSKMDTMLDAATKRSGNGAASLLWQASIGDGRLRVEEEMTDDILEKIKSLEELRRAANSLGGNLVIENAPLILKENFDSWGDAGNAAEIMRNIKAQMDSENRFSPGRFAAGI
ncbi:MAG TPA: FAD-linked oxidase C-terminal domain-containing protein [Pyrinomonadaceae bacterium]|jgi:glycolate oxidase subunit GlcD